MRWSVVTTGALRVDFMPKVRDRRIVSHKQYRHRAEALEAVGLPQ